MVIGFCRDHLFVVLMAEPALFEIVIMIIIITCRSLYFTQQAVTRPCGIDQKERDRFFSQLPCWKHVEALSCINGTYFATALCLHQVLFLSGIVLKC